jgi:hypothetical protein
MVMRMGSSTAVAIGIVAVIVSRAGFAAPAALAPEASPMVKAGDVVKQPLNDLNLVKPQIAPVLVRAKTAPYAPAGSDCGILNAELQELDIALGPDFDAAGGKKASLSKKLSDGGFSLARGAVSSFIPYRGIVREVTGAEKRARDVNDALLAGMVRRAYLKANGEMLGCAYTASAQRVGQTPAILVENPQD